jgi:hypothetical protein
MRARKPSTTDYGELALHTLLRVIASRDRKKASQVLAKTPSLARMSVQAGATRANASTYFLKEIGHYAYAGDTPLHIAAAAYQRGIAEELVLKGASVSARNRRGAEPLHYASDGSPDSWRWDPDAQFAVIEFLIGAGAGPDSADKSGVVPLHRAVRTRCTAAVRALLENGSDPRIRNASGSTPLHLAVQNTGRGGSGSAASRDEQAKIIRLLLDHGARASDKDLAGKTVKDFVRSDWIRALL